jgi:hypothetical protein
MEQDLATKATIRNTGFTVVAGPESPNVEYGYHLVNLILELRVRA